MSKNNYQIYFLVLSIMILFIIYKIGKTSYPRKKDETSSSFKKNDMEIIFKKTNIITLKKEPSKEKIEYPFDPTSKDLINIPTRSFDTSYRQIGVLRKIYGNKEILPLMARSLYHKINKWQYYTTNSSGTIQLPISKYGKSCSSKKGCFEIKNGQSVYVEGYDQVFLVILTGD